MKARKLYLILYYLLRISILFALFLMVINQRWLDALTVFGIAVLIFLPSVIKKKFNVNIPLEIELVAVLFIFLSVFLGDWLQYYYRFWWWDVYLHFLSGILLGLLGFLLMYVLNDSQKFNFKINAGAVAFFGFTFAVALGAIWEIVEYIIDSTFGTNMQKSGLHDTMWDLIMDVIGGGLISLSGYLWLKERLNFFVFDRSLGKLIIRNRGMITPIKRE